MSYQCPLSSQFALYHDYHPLVAHANILLVYVARINLYRKFLSCLDLWENFNYSHTSYTRFLRNLGKHAAYRFTYIHMHMYICLLMNRVSMQTCIHFCCFFRDHAHSVANNLCDKLPSGYQSTKAGSRGVFIVSLNFSEDSSSTKQDLSEWWIDRLTNSEKLKRKYCSTRYFDSDPIHIRWILIQRKRFGFEPP